MCVPEHDRAVLSSLSKLLDADPNQLGRGRDAAVRSYDTIRSGVVVAVAVMVVAAVLVMAVVRVVVVDGWCRVLQNSLVALEELRHFLVT